MPVIGNLREIFNLLTRHNWWAIFYFNFKMLPFKQAIKLPFDFYYSVRFENVSGRVQLEQKTIRRGMIKIGGRGSEMFSRSQSILDIQGTVIFRGVCELGHGVLLRVDPGGQVDFGHNVRLGALTKLFCKNKIKFGDEIDFSWECQIFDTNFHYLIDTRNESVDPICGTVNIGSRNWFGNRITAMKGCRTAENTVVASNSLCNKDYSSLGSCIVIGGMPAKLLRKDTRRLFEGVDDDLIARAE